MLSKGMVKLELEGKEKGSEGSESEKWG